MLNIHKVFHTSTSVKQQFGNVCLFSTVMFIGSTVVLVVLNSSIFSVEQNMVNFIKGL